MNKNKYLRLVISLLLAVSVSVFVFYKAQEINRVEYQKVVVIKKTIPQNESITPENVEISKRQVGSTPKGTLTKVPTDKLAAMDLYPGQCLMSQMLADRKTTVEKPEHRVFPISVNLSSTGLIQAGDLVDILMFTGGKNAPGQSKLILSGVKVNSVLNSGGRQLKKTSNSESKIIPAVVELLVTAQEANMLNYAVNTGTFTLAKYNATSEPVPVPGVNHSQIEGGMVDEATEATND